MMMMIDVVTRLASDGVPANSARRHAEHPDRRVDQSFCRRARSLDRRPGRRRRSATALAGNWMTTSSSAQNGAPLTALTPLRGVVQDKAPLRGPRDRAPAVERREDNSRGFK